MVIVVIIMIVAVIGVLFVAPKKAAQPTPTVPAVSSAPVESLATKSALTEADVQGLDKTNAFWAYYKNAAQQSLLTTTKEYYFADSPTAAPASRTFKRTGFDYTSKKIMQAIDLPDEAAGNRMKYRCYDGKEYVLTPTSSYGWREKDADDKFYCQLDKESSDINDGINTGGLTAAQSEAMIQTLRRQEGLVTVDTAKLMEHKGKQYISFDVTLHPRPTNEENVYMGNQWWMWAFKETKLKPATHPFGYLGAGGNGMKITYVVDPATKLPAYSEISITPRKDTSGKDIPMDNYSFHRTQYTFGSLPDVTTVNEQDVTLDW